MLNNYIYPKKVLDELKQYNRDQSIKRVDIPKFVFICGKDMSINQGGNRLQINKFYDDIRKDVICLYSEKLCDIFEIDFIDLLTFEELLVELSDGIILFVESFGTACELGAFSMKEEIISKLLVFNDIKYKDTSSFINDGPIKKIINRNNENVIFTKMETVLQHPDSFQKLINFIPKEKNIKLNNDNNKVKLNSFIFELLNLISLFMPIKSKELIYIYKYIKNFNNFNYYSISSNKSMKHIKFNQIIQLLSKFNLVTIDKNKYIRLTNNNYKFNNIMFNLRDYQFNTIRSKILCKKYKYKEGIIA